MSLQEYQCDGCDKHQYFEKKPECCPICDCSELRVVPSRVSTHISNQRLIYEDFKHQPYTHWFAISEFIDNSVSSYLEHKDKLREINGDNYVLDVHIDFSKVNQGTLTIEDNAAGIDPERYEKAFSIGALRTPNAEYNQTLNEYGRGMKVAGFWFSPTWEVESSFLGDPVQKHVVMSLDNMTKENGYAADVKIRKQKANKSFTRLTLTQLKSSGYKKWPKPATVSKIKRHLSDIYRVLIDDSDGQPQLRLFWKFDQDDGFERIYPQDYGFLKAKKAKSEDPQEITWSAKYNWSLGEGKSISAHFGILAKGSYKQAGFIVYRKDRGILGTGEKKWKPERIFKATNSFESLRLFGFVNVEGFRKLPSTDNIDWEGKEEIVIDGIIHHLTLPEMDFIHQVKNHKQPKPKNSVNTIVKEPTERLEQSETSNKTLDEVTKPNIEGQSIDIPEDTFVPKGSGTIKLEHDGTSWIVNYKVTTEPTFKDYVKVEQNHGLDIEGTRNLDITIGLESPFLNRYARSPESYEPLLRIAVAICVSEKLAELAIPDADLVRINLNKILEWNFNDD